MSTGDVRNVFRVPGRLSFGATNLATAYPHGGTAIGIVGAKVLRPAIAQYVVTAEEFGGDPIEHIVTGYSWVLTCLLREYDSDVIAKLFPSTSVGSSTGKRVIKHGSGNLAHPLASNRVMSNLVFTPNDQTKHVGFIMYRALPEVDGSAGLAMALNQNQEIAVAFTSMRKQTAAESMQIGFLADLTL